MVGTRSFVVVEIPVGEEMKDFSIVLKMFPEILIWENLCDHFYWHRKSSIEIDDETMSLPSLFIK